MADVFTEKERSAIMSKIRSKETKIEVLFRKALWAKGFRYRKNCLKYFGKPDIALKKYQTVIFVDSCFWHKCAFHGHLPKSNIGYWAEKFIRNKKRDKEVNKHYNEKGWEIIRIWEHDLSNKTAGKLAGKIGKRIRRG